MFVLSSSERMLIQFFSRLLIRDIEVGKIQYGIKWLQQWSSSNVTGHNFSKRNFKKKLFCFFFLKKKMDAFKMHDAFNNLIKDCIYDIFFLLIIKASTVLFFFYFDLNLLLKFWKITMSFKNKVSFYIFSLITWFTRMNQRIQIKKIINWQGKNNGYKNERDEKIRKKIVLWIFSDINRNLVVIKINPHFW